MKRSSWRQSARITRVVPAAARDDARQVPSGDAVEIAQSRSQRRNGQRLCSRIRFQCILHIGQIPVAPMHISRCGEQFEDCVVLDPGHRHLVSFRSAPSRRGRRRSRTDRWRARRRHVRASLLANFYRDPVAFREASA
jgi:hypothetical protein